MREVPKMTGATLSDEKGLGLLARISDNDTAVAAKPYRPKGRRGARSAPPPAAAHQAIHQIWQAQMDQKMVTVDLEVEAGLSLHHWDKIKRGLVSPTIYTLEQAANAVGLTIVAVPLED